MISNFARGLLASIVLLAAATGIAQALPVVYVASNGSDSNPGTQSKPCLTFSGAYNKTDVNGTIIVLNPGVYHSSTTGPLEIYKNITINGGAGRMGKMTLGVALDGGTLTLVNLDIGSIYDGVDIAPHTALVVSSCEFNCTGVAVNDLYGPTKITITNSIISGGHRGVWTNPGNTGVSVTLLNDEVSGTSGAAVFIESGTASVEGCTISSSHDGLVADSGGSIDAESNTISHNVIGALVNTGSTLSITANDFVDNKTAIDPDGKPAGVITANKGNRFEGDSNVPSGPLVPIRNVHPIVVN